MQDALQCALFWAVLKLGYRTKQASYTQFIYTLLYDKQEWDVTYPETLISQLQTIWQLHAAVWLWQSDLNGRQAACFRYYGLHRQLTSQGFKVQRILLISLSYSSILFQQQHQLLVLKAMAGMILTYTGMLTDLYLQTLLLRTPYLVREQQR